VKRVRFVLMVGMVCVALGCSGLSSGPHPDAACYQEAATTRYDCHADCVCVNGGSSAPFQSDVVSCEPNMIQAQLDYQYPHGGCTLGSGVGTISCTGQPTCTPVISNGSAEACSYHTVCP
jgi:hypothetical protein